jgi:hypothetical protein
MAMPYCTLHAAHDYSSKSQAGFEFPRGKPVPDRLGMSRPTTHMRGGASQVIATPRVSRAVAPPLRDGVTSRGLSHVCYKRLCPPRRAQVQQLDHDATPPRDVHMEDISNGQGGTPETRASQVWFSHHRTASPAADVGASQSPRDSITAHAS